MRKKVLPSHIFPLGIKIETQLGDGGHFHFFITEMVAANAK